MDDERNHHAPQPDPAPIEDWIDQQASMTGIERSDVLDDLMSAYWTLNEIVGLVDRTTGPDHALQEPPADATTVPRPSHPDTDDLDELKATLETIEERLETLEDTIPEDDLLTLSEDVIQALRKEILAGDTAASAKNDATKRLVQTEFSHLRSILEHLLDSTDELDRRADTVDRTLEAVNRHLVDHEGLVTLKQKASRLNIQQASCEHCAASISLALLAIPFCPTCERKLTGITRERSRLGLRTNVVTVAPDTDQHRRQSLTWREHRNQP